jgi:membrane-associated phospholipid phosphatase
VFTRATGDLAQTERGGDGGRAGVASVAIPLAVGYFVLSASLIAVGLVLTHLLAPVRHWDNHVNRWLAARRAPGWTRASRDGTFLADTLGVVVVAVVATLVALACRCGRASALFLCGLALELGVFLTVNYTVKRPRPVVPRVGSTPSTYSFPSGHVAATLVLYGGIAVLVASRTRATWAQVVAWAVAACVVAWVAFSRVYEAEHHPTDVMAGFCLGVGALAAAVRGVQAGRLARHDGTTVRGVVVAHQATGPYRLPGAGVGAGEEAAG